LAYNRAAKRWPGKQRLLHHEAGAASGAAAAEFPHPDLAATGILLAVRPPLPPEAYGRRIVVRMWTPVAAFAARVPGAGARKPMLASPSSSSARKPPGDCVAIGIVAIARLCDVAIDLSERSLAFASIPRAVLPRSMPRVRARYEEGVPLHRLQALNAAARKKAEPILEHSWLDPLSALQCSAGLLPRPMLCVILSVSAGREASR